MNKKTYTLTFLLFYINTYLIAKDADYEYKGISIITNEYLIKIIIMLIILITLSGLVLFYLKNIFIKFNKTNNTNIKINHIINLYEDKKIMDFEFENYKYTIILNNNYFYLLNKKKRKINGN